MMMSLLAGEPGSGKIGMLVELEVSINSRQRLVYLKLVPLHRGGSTSGLSAMSSSVFTEPCCAANLCLSTD